MRVRLLCDRCGPYHGQQLDGEVVDLPDAEARRLVEHKQAEPAEAQPERITHKPLRRK